MLRVVMLVYFLWSLLFVVMLCLFLVLLFLCVVMVVLFLSFAVNVVVVFGDIAGCKAPGYRAAGSKAASCQVVNDRTRPGRARFKLLSCHRGFARRRPAGGDPQP